MREVQTKYSRSIAFQATVVANDPSHILIVRQRPFAHAVTYMNNVGQHHYCHHRYLMRVK